jgi:hypothetical protein
VIGRNPNVPNQFNHDPHVIAQMRHGNVPGVRDGFARIFQHGETVCCPRDMFVEQLACPIARASVEHEDVELRCRQVLSFEVR